MNERLQVTDHLVARREKLNNVLSRRQAVRACLEVYGLKRDISAESVGQLLGQVFGEPVSLRIRESLKRNYSPEEVSGNNIIEKVMGRRDRLVKINSKLTQMEVRDDLVSGLVAGLETQLKEEVTPQIKKPRVPIHETRINALIIAISGETPDPRKVIEALGETREGKPHTWSQAAAAIRNALNRLRNVKEKDMTEEERKLKDTLLKYMDDNKLISFSQISQRVEDVLKDYGQEQKGLKAEPRAADKAIVNPEEPTLFDMINGQEVNKLGQLKSPMYFIFGTLEGDVYDARINGRNQALFLSSIPFEDEAIAVSKSRILDLIFPGDSDGNKKLENLYNGTNLTLFRQTNDVLIQKTRIGEEICYYLRVIKDTESGTESSFIETETTETAASIEVEQLPEPDIQPSYSPVTPPNKDTAKVENWISKLEIGDQNVELILETEQQALFLSQLRYKEKGIPENDALVDQGFLCKFILGQGQNKRSRKKIDKIISEIQVQIEPKRLEIKMVNTSEGVSYYVGPCRGNKPDAVKDTKGADRQVPKRNLVDISEFSEDTQLQNTGKIKKIENRTKGEVRGQVQEILKEIDRKITEENFPHEPNAEGLTNYFKWLTMGALEKFIERGFIERKRNPDKYFGHAYYDIYDIAAIDYWKTYRQTADQFDNSLITGLRLVIQQEWEKLNQEKPSSGNGN